MQEQLRTGMAFGLTSAVITTLGLMVGLHSGTHSRLVVLGGIAVARGAYDYAARLFGAGEALRGDSPVNRFERPVIDRFEPELEAALPAAEHAALRDEGVRLGADVVRRDFVVTRIQE